MESSCYYGTLLLSNTTGAAAAGSSLGATVRGTSGTSRHSSIGDNSSISGNIDAGDGGSLAEMDTKGSLGGGEGDTGYNYWSDELHPPVVVESTSHRHPATTGCVPGPSSYPGSGGNFDLVTNDDSDTRGDEKDVSLENGGDAGWSSRGRRVVYKISIPLGASLNSAFALSPLYPNLTSHNLLPSLIYHKITNLSSHHPIILSSYHPIIPSSHHPIILSSYHPIILSSHHPIIFSH